jgi:hypothetical protein
MSHSNTEQRVQDLLARLEPMNHSSRMKFMVQYGKNPDLVVLKNVLDALERGDVYQRQLALVSCGGNHDSVQVSARVLRGLQDPSNMVRGLAVGLVAQVFSETQLLQAEVLGVLIDLPHSLRLTVLKVLHSHKKAARVANALLEHYLATGNTREVTALLAFTSREVVQKHLASAESSIESSAESSAESIMEKATPSQWRRLAHTQPELVANWLETRAQNAVEYDGRLFRHMRSVLYRIAEYSPQRMVQILRLVPRDVPLASWWLQPILQRWPRQIATLALESDETPFLDFSAVAHRLELSQIVALHLKHPSTLGQLQSRLARFAPADRVTLFEGFRGAWVNTFGIISAHILRLLPRALRESEAKRHLEHPRLQTERLAQMPYASLLGWQEAHLLLEPSIKHPKPEQRLAAVAAQIGSARYGAGNGAGVAPYDAALELVAVRKNEQDPIRGAMLGALADLPPARWQTAQLERLGHILQDALNAADLSGQTAIQAERLVVGVLPFQLEWATQWIKTLVKERGQINWFGIGSRVSNIQARAIAAQLLPVVRAWQTREREAQILHLFQHLGQRMRVLPDFLELAEGLVTTSSNAHLSRTALSLIATYDPARFRRLVPELLHADPSWATVDLVYLHLHQQRQDLLTPFLGHTAYKGKYSTGKTRFVLPVSSGFQRWNPAQHHIFVQTLEEVALDSERDIPAILRVLVQLSQIPNASRELITLLAEESNPRLAVRDAALRALGRLDEFGGLESLLRALDDSRARVAIYALRRLFVQMSQSAALDTLKRTPLERVTVAKEVLRLIGELRSEDAYAYLLERSLPTTPPHKPLHRDVRVALLRALWDYLEDTRTWEVLQAAAGDSDPAIADGVIRIPTDRLSGSSQQKLVTVLATLIQHPDADVRLQTLQRLILLPIHDANTQLAQPLLNALHANILKQTYTAAQAFFITYTGTDFGLIEQAFLSLLPQRQSLHFATEAVLDYHHYRGDNQQLKVNSSARAVLAALRTDPNTLHMQIRLVFQFLPIAELGALIIELADQAQLHADNYQIAKLALFHLAQQRSHPQQNLHALEQVWKDHPLETVRRLALESLILCCANTGWNPENLQQLERYRADPSSLVSAAAQFTFPI